MVRIFVTAIADVHQTYAQLGLFVEAMGGIKSGLKLTLPLRERTRSSPVMVLPIPGPNHERALTV